MQYLGLILAAVGSVTAVTRNAWNLPEKFLLLSGALMLGVGLWHTFVPSYLSALAICAAYGGIGCAAMQAPNYNAINVIVPHVLMCWTLWAVWEDITTSSGFILPIIVAYFLGGGYRCILVPHLKKPL
eukprot:GEMP01121839.1.p1 GENE.GEMP01121839.1~~GEMP01121839.1.p1  ORF type:complete len:128 (+),score=18.09 GEMP01121839.1:49-432(+)